MTQICHCIAMLSSRSLDFVASEGGVCVCMCARMSPCVSQHWDHSCSNAAQGLDVFYFFF